eukprot:3026220-Prymnesium_polylepis.1
MMREDSAPLNASNQHERGLFQFCSPGVSRMASVAEVVVVSTSAAVLPSAGSTVSIANAAAAAFVHGRVTAAALLENRLDRLQRIRYSFDDSFRKQL